MDSLEVDMGVAGVGGVSLDSLLYPSRLYAFPSVFSPSLLSAPCSLFSISNPTCFHGPLTPHVHGTFLLCFVQPQGPSSLRSPRVFLYPPVGAEINFSFDG